MDRQSEIAQNENNEKERKKSETALFSVFTKRFLCDKIIGVAFNLLHGAA